MPDIISREEAKAAGLKTFCTGRPCKRGCVSSRLTCNGRCLCEACSEHQRSVQKACSKRWRDANTELARKRSADSALKHRDRRIERMRKYRAENAESLRLKGRDRRRVAYQADPDRFRAAQQRYVKANPERAMDTLMRYRDANRPALRQAAAERAERVRVATPIWYGEIDAFLLKEAYELAHSRELATGVEWQVDHMLALRAEAVCGLHCAENIQVLPAKLNLLKRNLDWLTAPFSWLQAIEDPASSYEAAFKRAKSRGLSRST